MATVSKLLTYEDWLRMPPVEDGRDEVVKGEYRFLPPNLYPHAEVIQALIEQLIPQLDRNQLDRKKTRVLGSTLGLIISRDPLTCRSPDLVVYWRERDRIEDGLHTEPPDLVVEVLSSSETRRRKEEKIEDYASIGVPEVWLCSPEAQSVEVRKLVDGRLATERIVVGGTLEPARLPGVKIAVEEIWPE